MIGPVNFCFSHHPSISTLLSLVGCCVVVRLVPRTLFIGYRLILTINLVLVKDYFVVFVFDTPL